MHMITERSNPETRSANAQNNTDIGNWCLDMVNNRLYWSDETYRIFGISKKDFLPYYGTFYNTIHPEDRAAWMAHHDLFLKGGIPMDMEHRIVLPTGEIRYVHEMGKRIVDNNNRLIWLSGTVEDITGRKTMPEEVENLEPVAKQTSSPVIVTDAEGDITWVNNAFERTFEYDLREVVGKKPGAALQGPETDLATLRYLCSKIEKREPFEIELLKYSKSGRRYWMLVKGHPIFDKTGNCTSFFTVQHHITEKKLAQEEIQTSTEYRHLFHQNPVPMWIFDYETLYFIEVNDAAVRQYGYSVAEFRQMRITDVRPDFHIEKKVVKMRLLPEKIKTHLIWTHIKKGGESIFVTITAHNIDYRGRKAVLVLANDVTETILAQKKVHEELILDQRASMEAAIETSRIPTSAKLYISSINDRYRKVHRLLPQSVSLVSNALAETRKLFKTLAAPVMKDLDLYSAVETLVDQLTAASPMTILFDTEMFYEDGLTKKVKTNVFRIIQEQLTDTANHAASEVYISLHRTCQKVYLVIYDNGQGADMSQKRNGFDTTNTAKRADKKDVQVTITSEPGMGCRLQAEFAIA